MSQLTRAERQDGGDGKNIVLKSDHAGVAPSSFIAQLPDLEEPLHLS